jgi:regulator of telomere elongation helicase 1
LFCSSGRNIESLFFDSNFQGKNALLESPTGTGKTLCLLCACLAWREKQARLLSATRQEQIPAIRIPEHSPTTPSTDNINPLSSSETKSIQPVPTIIYTSRTHSQLTQVINELKRTEYK